ncbi:hypothetical protein GQ53DRAFT_878448 [Thozetella sp. PMI_491]|nr:hypothetical protein GQ53DRAFT_878448 [Thozetella sp. PMI_491]
MDDLVFTGHSLDKSIVASFIENQLPRNHPLFDNPPVHYDLMVGQYVADSRALVRGGNLWGDSVSAPWEDVESPSRPAWTDTQAMVFWNDIFSQAMSRFTSTTSEPRGRSQTAYDIRHERDWDAVYDKLEAARNEYKNRGGFVGWIRKRRREIADNIAPVAKMVSVASKAVPNDPCATPVLCVVEVLLDAAKNAAKVRQKVLEGFDGLIPIFSDVELFLGTYPKDINILNASLDLTATTLEAVERAIGFFISNEFLKGGKAIFQGEGYEKSLLQSIATIDAKSKSLMSEAVKSHIYELHNCKWSRGHSRETKRIFKQIAQGFNSMFDLLVDHLKEKDRQLSPLEAARQENVYLRVENGLLRTSSPANQNRRLPPPPTVVQDCHVDQDALRRTLEAMDIDLVDASFVVQRKAQFPPRQLVQAEQIINAPLFRHWIVSPSSAKLLVQWAFHPPRSLAGISPLSVFCATMTQALRIKPRFVSTLWFCGRHIDTNEARPRVGGRAMLTSLIDQLLRQYSFDMLELQYEVDLANIRGKEGPQELVKLLRALIYQLPEIITTVCIIDGVNLFEREELRDEALPVVSALLSLANDTNLPSAVKVLLVSTTASDIIRAAFEPEDLILNVDALPQLTWAPSDERMVRELGLELEEEEAEVHTVPL